MDQPRWLSVIGAGRGFNSPRSGVPQGKPVSWASPVRWIPLIRLILLACRLADAIGGSAPDRDDLRTCVLGEIRAAGPFLADKPRILGYPVDAVPGAAGYWLGSDRGSPNHGSTLASKRVMPQICPPARVST